jgi:hypothetical protein
VAPVGKGDIWFFGDGTDKPVVAHWNGKRWTRERVPLPTSHSGPWTIAADGHGGLWMNGNTGALYDSEDALFTYNAAH